MKGKWWEPGIETVRKWTEELELREYWRWVVRPKIFDNPHYRAATDGAIAGEINESGRNSSTD